MRTDDWIDFLSTAAPAVQRAGLYRRWSVGLSGGVGLALLLVVTAYGLRPDLFSVYGEPMLWIKLVFPASVALGASVAVWRLGHPGTPLGRSWWVVLVAFGAIWLLAAWTWLDTPAERQGLALWGNTWRTCAPSIAAVSMPVFVGGFWALRGMAPTRPGLAGAAIGLLAGGAGALVYALHCPEMSPVFVAVWNTLGIVIPTALGAYWGPRLLRW